MTDKEGAFYSAIDAESEQVEGKFYRWKKETVQKLLGKDFDYFAQYYSLNGEPNFEEHYYVPQFSRPLAEILKEKNVEFAAVQARLAPLRKRLFEHRSKRPRPLTDTKTLTAWNGLMIAGLADAGRLLKEERYIRAAARAADFVLAKLRRNDGRLLRTYRNGQAKLNAYLDDYAFLASGLIALHRATGEKKWLTAAAELTDKQIELFADKKAGGFFFTSGDHEKLIARAKDPIDGSIPAGNSVAAENLVYLGRELGRDRYLARAEDTIRAFASHVAAGSPRLATALARLLRAKK